MEKYQIDLGRVAGQVSGPSKLKICAISSNIRHLPADLLLNASVLPEVDAIEGDIVVSEVLSDTGSINTIENNFGRDVRLYAGDIFLGVLANRHSSTSEYGSIPSKIEIRDGTVLDLLAVGGILGFGEGIPPGRANQSFLKIKPLGVLAKNGKKINISDLYSNGSGETAEISPIVFVTGTSAEVGKTTVSAGLIRALKRKGWKVGAAKLTGTGRLRDILAMNDAGAHYCSDFPNVGLASTYTNAEKTCQAAVKVLSDITRKGCNIIVAELGGDIIEANIPSIFSLSEVKNRTIGIVHVSGDVLGILGSIKYYGDMKVDSKIYFTLPKGRNNVGTSERLKVFDLNAFDALSTNECDTIVDEIINSHDWLEHESANK